MYRILPDDEAIEQVAALPTDLLPHYAEALDIMKRAPWTGEPYHSRIPYGAMRRLFFGPDGRGVVIYLVVEDRERVDVLRVYWL